MKNIIDVKEAKTLGRPIGKVADDKITAFINEVEQTIIRRALGDELYLQIIAFVSSEDGETFDESFDDSFGDSVENFKMLLDGGRYKTKCGGIKILTGLKVAEAYFVYAQNVRAGDFESTRYGMVVKDDSYSNGLTPKERDFAANNATEIAQTYLNECIEYCRDNGILPRVRRGNEHITAGCVIRKIRNI